LTPQLSPDATWLGRDDEWRTTYQRSGFKLFEQWGLGVRNFSDAQGRLNFYAQQALAYFHWKLHGIGVFQVVSKDRPRSPLPFALLPIDPCRLSTPTSALGANIYDGVEVDDDGLPVAAWIRKSGATGSSKDSFTRVPVWHQETGLPQVLLVSGVRNIAEYREDSILGSMIPELRNNADFVAAALVRALIANMFVLNLRQANPTSLGDKFEDRFQEVEQGMILRTGPTEDAKFLANDAPGPNYDKMFESIIARLGMATSRGPENITRKYTASYSASRMSQNKAEQITESEHALVLNAKFSGPALGWMLYGGVLRGRLDVADMNHFLDNLDDYARAEWLPQPSKHLDPLKSANAAKIDRSTGCLTLREMCARQGRDWRDHVDQLADEAAYVRGVEAARDVSLGILPGEADGGIIEEETKDEENGDAAQQGADGAGE